MDYTKLGFKSHSDYFVRCKVNYSMAQFGGRPSDVVADEQVDVDFVSNGNKTNFAFDEKMSKYCLDFCGNFPDCHSEYYHVELIRIVPQTNWFYINIRSPIGFNTKYIHSPKLKLIEFLCFVGSQLSLWTGFTLLAISRCAFRCLQFFYKRFVNKEKIRAKSITFIGPNVISYKTTFNLNRINAINVDTRSPAKETSTRTFAPQCLDLKGS